MAGAHRRPQPRRSPAGVAAVAAAAAVMNAMVFAGAAAQGWWLGGYALALVLGLLAGGALCWAAGFAAGARHGP